MPLFVRTLLATGPPEQVEAAARTHRRQLRELRAQGRLRLAGEFTQSDGFLEILEASDLLEAETLARDSPLVREGLCSWTLREWIELDLES